MIGHIKVGQLMNSFMLTKLAMFETQAVNTSIETFSYYISPKRIFRASADWNIISGVMIWSIGVATIWARIEKQAFIVDSGKEQ